MTTLARRTTVAVTAAAVAGTLAGIGGSVWAAAADGSGLPVAAFNAAVVAAFALVGAIVAGSRPRNRVGWLMLAAGVSWSLGAAAVDVAHHGIVVAPGSVPGASAYAVAGSAARAVGWYLLTLGVTAYFPDGRLADRRLRWLPPVLVVILVSTVVDPLTDAAADLRGFDGWHNPIAPPRPWSGISGVAFLGHVPLGLVAAAGIIAGLRLRWRRGEAVARQQLLLLVGAAVLPVLAVPVAFAVPATGDWVFGVAAVPLPFAIGFAVLARGLYDLRTAANRTLVWLTLSAVTAGLYAVVIAGVGSRVDTSEGHWLAWVAAAVVAVSFAPIRDLLQRGINRVTFGRWDEPYEVLATLGQRLEASADINRLLLDVVGELHGLGLGSVSICDVRGHLLAGDATAQPAPGTEVVDQPLVAFGQLAGTLRYRPPGQPLRSRDRQLLNDLTGHLGGVLHAHQLTLDLRDALQRQVLTREEERRRLRRDLHDGLGPALAGHLLRLDLIAAEVGCTATATRHIAQLQDELRGTVSEVRRVVEGLRPPALDELGLAGALDQVLQRLTSGSPVHATLHVGSLPPLSAAIEVAAFRIATEAVTNVIRHAGATCCDVRLDADPTTLRVTVADNGRGMGRRGTPCGNGLLTMRERAEELRGRLTTTTGNGTTVVAEFPLAPEHRLGTVAGTQASTA